MIQDGDSPNIRPLRPSDLDTLVELYNNCTPHSPKSVSDFSKDLLGSEWPDGLVRVILAGKNAAGFAHVVRIPGLDRYYELNGCIRPGVRNQGLGSRLLESILKELQSKGAKVATFVSKSERDPGASFLLKKGFSIEHQEWIMGLDLTADTHLSAAWPPDYSAVSYSKEEAIATFRELYDQIFADFPWYQPYESEQQVARELADPANLLFLRGNNMSLGFCWTRQRDITTGEIEPIGLLKKYRRKGLGKNLLLESLFRLKKQGTTRIEIGTWEENQPAIALYRRTGFKRIQTVKHLGFHLQSNI